jgi:4-amino-4-deoxy-L-arabinose transferase-like glycosyltransferase
MTAKNAFKFCNYFFIISAILLSAISVISIPFSRACISHTGFYLTFILFLLWICALIRSLAASKPDVPGFIKSNAAGIVISILLACTIFLSVEPIFRVLSDETNLASVSKSMLYERRADNVTMGKWYYDNFYPMNREIEKRPLMFPFFMYLVHLVFGYHPENAFILNFLVLITLFFLIYRIGKGYWGEMGGMAGVILVAAQPIVSQTATSGGFDLFFVLFLTISFLAVRSFLKDRSPLRFELLWLTLVMVASSRYEGIMLMAIVVAFLYAFRYLKKELFASGFGVSFFITPLLLLPYLWSRVIVKDTFQTQDAA